MNEVNSPELPGLVVKAVESPPSMVPTKGREQPALWVQMLAVHSDWPPSEGNLLRRMKLRRGLNILWARPSAEDSAGTKLTGHGAGKTTFCRMLRYLLDDATFGTEDFRKAFNDTEHGGCRNGWVLGEVIVAGEQWLVGRPLGHAGYQSFAKKHGSLPDTFPDHPTSTGYDDYVEAMDKAVFGKMALRTLSGSGRQLKWVQLLGWLARDQEAHYSGLLDWRHPDSDHMTGDMPHPDRENLVRLVLGLINPEEQKLLREHAEKSGEHEDGVREKPKLDFLVRRTRDKLETLLGHRVADPKDELLQQEIATLVAEQEKQFDASSVSAAFDKELDRLSGAVAARDSAWRMERSMLLGLISKLPQKERDLAAARQEATDAEQHEAVRVLHPFRNYCSHLLTRAWKAQCPLADDRPTDEQVDKVLQATVAAAKTEGQQREQLDEEIKAQQATVTVRLGELNAARKELAELRSARDAKLNQLSLPRLRATELKSALTDYRTACAELSGLNANLARLDKEKRRLDSRLEAFSEQHDALVHTFTRIFHHLVQQTMGSSLTGTVEFSGKGIEPRIRDHARRDSPAIKVAKFLAFDIASMILTMTTGEGHHPRLLIHDSPREADLDARIYRSLFTVVRDLEIGEESAFQHIVTTTETPPADLNRPPWRLDPVLDASAPDSRLLGVDL